MIRARFLCHTLLCSLATPTLAEYTDMIYETHYTDTGDQDGISLTHDVDDRFSVTSERPIQHKAVFELVSINIEDPSDSYILDTKTVYASAPQAEIAIVSDSTATGIPRTRADKPFYVTYSVKNLQAVEDTRLNSAILVYQTTGGKVFDENITQNTSAKEKSYSPMSLFSGETAESLHGTVTFSLVENNGTESYNDEFANQEVLILPKHSGSISGIEEGETYSSLPSVQFDVANVYPQATMQVRLFKSDNPSNYKAIECGATFINPKDELMTPESLGATSLNNGYLDSGGEWTLQWVHTSTAWGEEVVDQVSFNYQTSINVRSRISTSN
ncbi:hypothetical protein [Rubritalea marina]|uniref:hypothetical protein n=1 Tax=Rubritalea marina TaxID=361055 RepID=UPI000370AFCA|nr:hypothetical protein [Rubritalea marina]